MRYWIITILGFLSCLAEAQKMDMQFAEKLLNKELAIFISKSDSEKMDLLMEKADLYHSRQEYVNALSELERAEKFSISQNNQLKYKKMLNYFLSDQFTNCASVLLSQEEVKQAGKEKEYFMMRFFSLNETGRWDKCKEELLSYCTRCDSNEIRKINSLAVQYEYVSPEQCRRLSSIIPGLGMAKTGKLFKGTTSFFLQAGLAAGIAYSFYSGYYAAGVVSGIFPLIKFHKGGNRFSAILAEERNEKEKKKLQALYVEEIKKVVLR